MPTLLAPVMIENDCAPMQNVEPDQAPEAAPEEQEMETSEQEAAPAEPAAAEPPAPELEAPTAPLEPAIIAQPQLTLPSGQSSCTDLFLCTLLEYRRHRKKVSFEVGFISLGWGICG